MVLIHLLLPVLDPQCLAASEGREVGNVIFMMHGGRGMTACYFLVFLKQTNKETNKTFLKHCNIFVGFFPPFF